MNINADFELRAAVHSDQEPWVASPMPGVDRRMLDRIGGEVARATSIVRYAPGSSFSEHTHSGGEEFLVLDGVFQDEHGDFPTGTYVRNPPTSAHTPSSAEGAIIFVKLWQFDPDDRQQVTIDTTRAKALVSSDGIEQIPLYQDHRETVRVELWQPQKTVEINGHEGVEALIIEGSIEERGETFEANAWLRLPPGAPLRATAGAQGARLWVKTGHLAERPTAPTT